MFQSCTPSKEFSSKKKIEPFAISYAKVKPAQIDNYRMVILEPGHYSKVEVDSLRQTGATLIGYLSLGEVNKSRWYYPLLEERGFLGTNVNWGSSYLNLADSTTQNILLEQVVPEIMIKGFDGLFLDTIDNVAPYTERAHLQQYMVEIIKKLNNNYPEAFIIQNAGLFLLDKTQEYIDAVLIEDVATLYNFETTSYELQPVENYRERVATIRSFSKKSGKEFMIVDFGVKEEFVERVTSRLDTLSIPYYISNIELNSLPSRPANH